MACLQRRRPERQASSDLVYASLTDSCESAGWRLCCKACCQNLERAHRPLLPLDGRDAQGTTVPPLIGRSMYIQQQLMHLKSPPLLFVSIQVETIPTDARF